MAEFSKNTDFGSQDGSIDSFLLDSGPVPDRLPPMLFLAALIHGILIIGITFNAAIGDMLSDGVSLEVTIVADPDPNVLEPEKAEYLAQANQQGAGNTEDLARPSAQAESAVPVDNPGTENGTSINESTFVDEVADEVLTTRAEQDNDVHNEPREDPTTEESTALAMEAGVELTLPLPQDAVTDTSIRDENPRELVTSINTRESTVAPYVNRWKRKIESVGAKYFPEQVLMDGITGSPTLDVTVNASGQLESAFVRASSGSRVLDQAALEILHRASPFDPFPEAVRVDYDTIRFVYKWQFSQIGVTSTASAN